MSLGDGVRDDWSTSKMGRGGAVFRLGDKKEGGSPVPGFPLWDRDRSGYGRIGIVVVPVAGGCGIGVIAGRPGQLNV